MKKLPIPRWRHPHSDRVVTARSDGETIVMKYPGGKTVTWCYDGFSPTMTLFLLGYEPIDDE